MWYLLHFCGLPALVRPFSLRPASWPSTILHRATSGLCSSFTVFPLATACGSIRPSRIFPCMSTYGNTRPFIVFLASPQPAILAVSALGSICSFPTTMQRWFPSFTSHQLVDSTDNSAALQGLLGRSVQGLAIDPWCPSTLLAALQNTYIHTDAQSSVPKAFEIAPRHRLTAQYAPNTAPNTAAETTLDTAPNTASETAFNKAHSIQRPRRHSI